MKKIVAFISAILYLTLTTGLAINIHYCMDKIEKVQFDNLTDKSCDNKAGMSCCKHDYRLIKVNDEHQQVAAGFVLKTPGAELHSFSNLIAQLSSPLLQQKITNANSPPLLYSSDICIQNCVFRI
jgi:hypothetical protein